MAQKKVCAASFDLWRVSWLQAGTLCGTGGLGTLGTLEDGDKGGKQQGAR